MTTEGHAVGKVILVGEHAVVFGAPAIAAGLDRGARACANPCPGSESRIRCAAWGIDVAAHEGHPLAAAFRAVLGTTRTDPVVVDIEADLPPGGGLGCSAALGVAVVRALHPAASPLEAAQRAKAWEMVFHGRPSGIDATTAALGGLIAFRRGTPPRRLDLSRRLFLCVGSSGEPSSTKSMLERVADMRQSDPSRVDSACFRIGILAQKALVALERGDEERLGALMNENHAELRGLGVSTEPLEHLVHLARDTWALGAKLTGSGGGGAAIALASSREHGQAIVCAWRQAGYEGFVSELAPTTAVWPQRRRDKDSETA